MGLASKKRRYHRLYKIKNKNDKIVPFIKNEAQKLIADARRKSREKRGCVRLLILKARQLGVTTDARTEYLDYVLFHDNKDVAIRAHDKDTQHQVLRGIKFTYAKIPSVEMKDGTVRNKPRAHYDNANEISFKDNGSRIRVALDTSGTTVSALHITELAKIDNAREVMANLLPSVPKYGDITIESTAKGINYLYELRNDCKDGNGPYDPLFIARYYDPDYRLPLDEGEVILLPDELKHLNSLDVELTDEQKKRAIEMHKTLGREFFQEYPSTPEEAFLTSGDSVFDLQHLRTLSNQIPEYIQDPLYPGLRIYRQPQKDGNGMPTAFYFRGVDTAEGGANGDFSSIKIRDKDYNLMASFYGRIPPDELMELADYLYSMGYQTMNMGIERNGVGQASIVSAKKYHWFQNVYRQEVYDERTERKTQKVGFYTGSNRKAIIEEFVRAVREGDISEIDQRELDEMFGFVYGNNNKPEASEGNHDDAIMADVICCWMIYSRPFI